VTEVDAFEEHRRHLFGVAYRMLGSVSEAEDLVQEAYLRWDRAQAAEVRSVRSYLTAIVTRLAIDRLRSAQRRREEYVGPWLPEPLVAEDDPAATAELSESLTVAFLVLLERLNPVERAVFLLHDVFGYDYAEVADVVGRGVNNCRQIARRSRAHLCEGRPPRYRAAPEEEQRLVQAFTAAATGDDVQGLLSVLADDVVFWSDGGAAHRAARQPVVGPHRVSRLVLNLVQRLPERVELRFLRANGEPTLLVSTAEGPHLTLGFEVSGGRIRALHSMVNPDKLRHLARAERSPGQGQRLQPADGEAGAVADRPDDPDGPG
jgi:RNA polymerase sigma-70 factor, ECF subfamily